jgi:ubiquinol-cytochrome c reductase cytochrome c subunit
MLSKGNVVPGLHNANITQAAEAMRIGPPPMPVFSENQLNEHDMSAIAHYVQYLHQPSNPGGLGISHFGPVAEGFVGILGFCILWFAARMIGTRG